MIHNKHDLFVKRMKENIKKNNLTNALLAEKLGYSEDAVKGWLRRKDNHFPNIDKLVELSEIFDVDVAYLLGEQDCKKISTQRIVDLTGLDEEAAENLICLNQKNPAAIAVLNYLLGVNAEKGINLLFLLYHYLFGNYQKIKGLDDLIVDLVDDIGFNGVALEISDLNSALKSMIDAQIQSIKIDIDSDAKWKDYGKNIPTKEEAEHIIKETQVEIDLANQNIEKYKSDEKKQDFWKRRLVSQGEIMEKYRHLLETKYKN